MAQRITSMIHSLFGTPASAARARPTAHAAGAGADSAAAAAAELHPWLLAARTVTAQAVPVRARRRGQWVDLPADESAQEALRRWRIHTGFEVGNPAAVAGDEAGRRSTVRRVLEDGEPCWSKVFNATQGSQKAEQNERRLLLELGSVASTPELSPRDHVAHLVKAQREAGGDGGRATATHIAQYLTTDAGPNLDTWCWLPRSFTIHRTVPATVCDRVTSTADGAMRNGIAFGLGLLF